MNSPALETQSLGMPWEEEYGYAQAVKRGNTVWISGQLGHDDQGRLVSGMEAQMRQAYRNINELLGRFGMSMDNIVEEVIYVLDTPSGFAARKLLGREFYVNPMLVASTLVQITGLALPGQVVEIKIMALQ
jgi:enamine deaminase RidA (YjgF/YER057c/UK114 family)